MPRNRLPVAYSLAEVPVYPQFCTFYSKKTGISDGPWLCEDENGKLAFISEEAKKECLSRPWHSVHGFVAGR